MKRIVLFFAILMIAGISQAEAQKALKIGHVNMDSVAFLMPEVDSMMTAIDARRAVHQRTLRIEEESFQQMYETFSRNMEGMPASWIEAKQEELINKQQTIENLRRVDFPNELQEIQDQYLQLMYEKIMEVVNTIAKEMHYTYVLNSGEGMSGVLFASPSEDLTGEVIKRLELDPNKPPRQMR
jgi:Skp family chaperone for outer membrane proteins